MIGGLIFDFDGLILETEGPIFQSWGELFKEHGCVLSLEIWGDIIGTAEDTFDPLAELERLVGVPLDRAALSPKRRQRELELITAQLVLPGVMDYLDAARQLDLKVAIASSSSRAWVNSHLTRLGLLDRFDCIKTADDVRLTKPDPELYLAALDCLGLEADQAIVFEDSPNGILAAKRAGLYCVVVPNDLTRQLRLDQANLQLNSLADLSLEALLEKVNHNHHRS